MDGKADCGREGASNRGAHAAAKEQFLWVAKHFGRSQSRAPNFGSLNCKRLDQKCYPYWLKEVSQQEMTAALIGALNS